MKTYLFSIYAEPKDDSLVVSKDIVIRTDKPLKDITDNLKEIFMQYLGDETLSLDFISSIKFYATSDEFYVYIDYDEISYEEIL